MKNNILYCHKIIQFAYVPHLHTSDLHLLKDRFIVTDYKRKQ